MASIGAALCGSSLMIPCDELRAFVGGVGSAQLTVCTMAACTFSDRFPNHQRLLALNGMNTVQTYGGSGEQGHGERESQHVEADRDIAHSGHCASITNEFV